MKKHIPSFFTKRMFSIMIALLPAIAYFFPVLCADTTTQAITRTGRKIQHDGFLMEWSTQTAKKWDSSGNWVWDAIVTSEGLAGYVCTKNSTACRNWTISITSQTDDQSAVLHLPPDSSLQCNQLKYDQQEYNDSGRITIEWLFPYKNTFPDTTKPKAVILYGTSGCGDTLSVLRLEYTAQSVSKSIKKKMAGQGILIAFLALMYFTIQRKIRRQTPQTVSPHQ